MLLLSRKQSLVVHTPAKLNLFLEVLGKRADGFHELESLFVTVSLYDTLCFREGRTHDIQLRCRNTGLVGVAEGKDAFRAPSGQDNLIFKAAHLLRERSGVHRGAQIDLWKRIPAESGLAGGSSDAAATLAALNRLWELNLPREELLQLAAELGSDVGFFLAQASAALCRGRGELIEPLRLPGNLHFVIARPYTGLSTARVFQRYQPRTEKKEAGKLVRSLVAGRLGEAGQCLHNALFSSAEKLNSDVGSFIRIFSQQPVLGYSMSGSGTACFGLCASRHQAGIVASRLAAMRVGRVYVAQCRP